jgi:hypothetical protein
MAAWFQSHTQLGLGILAAVALAAGGCASRPDDPQGSPQPYERPEYQLLSETGLFSNQAARRLARDVSPYTPNFALWSDGADKQRWIALPDGSRIDSTDMDRWQLPIGTRVWKEFSLGGRPLETRLIERYGTGDDDYWMGAFVWQEDGRDASLAPEGEHDLLGTAHDAPSQRECGACHGGEPGRVLGFSALQLPAGSPEDLTVNTAVVGAVRPEVTLTRLVAAEFLVPLPSGAHYGPPGDPVTAKALGYLHANCGHCHNPWAAAWRMTNMLLRLDVENVTPEESGVFQSIVGQSLDHFDAPEFELRVMPGEPEQSAIIARMESRAQRMQMPPLSTEEADSSGVDAVRRWVASLHE